MAVAGSKNATRGGHGLSVPSHEDAMTRDGILLHSDYVWLGSAYAVHRTLGDLRDFALLPKVCQSRSIPIRTGLWPFGWLASGKLVSAMCLASCFATGCTVRITVAMLPAWLKQFEMCAVLETQCKPCGILPFDSTLKLACFERPMRNWRFCVYLDDLYNTRRWAATRGFFASLPYLITGTSPLLKEVVRFLGVQVFGLEQFIALAARRTRRTASNA